MIGKIVDGRYRVDRLLGSGGMGSVFEAWDLAERRTVAVKVILEHLARGEAAVQRFEREAKVAGTLDTDHIARCFATGTDPATGSPYMVLEHLAGEDVQRLLRRVGPLSPDAALRILAQACLGISRAHAAGVVHRDLKPANLFLARGEGGARTVKILDFGVAKIRRDEDVDAETSGLTRTGAMLGSPLYMSPEQARSVKNVDHRSDLWSLGVVLYQALAGRTPFEHLSGLGDLILALCSELPPPVQRFSPWVSPEVAAIVDRALRPVPAERYQTADEMLAALQAELPGGVALHEAMLGPLDAAARSRVAPRYASPASRSAAPLDPGAQSSGRTPALADSLPAATLRTPTGQHGLATNSTLRASDEQAPMASPPRGALPQLRTIALAVACVVGGGAGMYALTPSASSRAGGAPVAQPTTIGPAPAEAPPAVAPALAVSTPPSTSPTEASSARPVASVVVRPEASPGPGATTASSGHAGPPRARSAPAAPSASAPHLNPLDYSSFGGRK